MRKARDLDSLSKFAERLNHTLRHKGLSSEKTKSGVRVKELSKVADCTVQMAHRYVYGLALPDYDSLKKIADWLEVPVGWLLYGEAIPGPHGNSNSYEIKYVERALQKVLPIFIKENPDEVIKFLFDILNNVNKMHADPVILFQYIDVAADSVKRFIPKGDEN